MKFLLFISLPLQLLAGDYCVLTKTNMAPALGDAVIWRSFLEPQVYTVVSTNWSNGIEVDTTNGMKQIHQTGILLTNRTIQFEFEGKHYSQAISVDSGPIVGQRILELPMPLSTTIPLRKPK